MLIDEQPQSEGSQGPPPTRVPREGGHPPDETGRAHLPGFVPPPAVPGRDVPAAAYPPPPPPPAAWSQASQLPTSRPVTPPPFEPGVPSSLHEAEPQCPPPAERTWGWRQSLAGLAVAFAPEVLLYLAAAGVGGGSTTTTRVTASSAIVLVASSFITYGWQLFAAWLFSLRRAVAGLRAWGFRKPTAAYFWTIPAALVGVYVVSFFWDLAVHPRQQQIVDQFPHTGAGLALFFLLAVVMAPLFEEMFFRGFLFKGFANSWGWFLGALVSGAIFGLAHLQLDVFVPLFALGFALAWVYHRTGSLWSNITLHAVFNAISVIAWYATK